MLRRLAATLAVLHLAAAPLATATTAQPADAAASVVVPSYWDPRRRTERPDMTRVPQIRFVTEEDFPPFNFAGPDGAPMGFNVDLARAVCAELGVPCTIQVRRFDTLLDAVERNQADAVIGAVAVTTELRRRFDASDRYLDVPARFLIRNATRLADAKPETLSGRSVAVAAGSAHEAYLRAYFRDSQIRPYPTAAAARRAVMDNDVDAVFADAASLASFLNSPEGRDCCRFLDRAFIESRYFGEGLSVIVRRGADPLRLALNHALQRLQERGVYAEIYLKSFPVGLY